MAWSCRMCTENPFVSLFDPPAAPAKDKEVEKKKKKKTGSKRNQASFHPRSEEEIKAATKQWEQYVHPRARDFFSTPEALDEILTHLAKGIDVNDDPVLGVEEKCVYWYGDITKDDAVHSGTAQAAIKMLKPGETTESVTYVNRVLAFIFATDESFEQLMQLPKEPFKMSCGDQLCVHLAHISLST